MAMVTVHEAKTHLSRLIARALAGEEVIVARGTEPVVKLVPVNPVMRPRRVGGWLTQGSASGADPLADGFWDPLPADDWRAGTGRWMRHGKRLLLDNHALIWWATGPGADRLSAAALEAIEDADNDVYVSAVSAMEIATKVRLGKLDRARSLARDFTRQIGDRGLLPLALSIDHAERGGNLGISNEDPFDRLLIAQAQIEQLLLVSNEESFDDYGVSRLW